MMRFDDLVAAISALQRSDLDAWIREEMVVPRQEAGALLFTDMECARVRLICTLHYELEIDVDTLPVVLSLVDQLYDTRQTPVVADRRRSGAGQVSSGGNHCGDSTGWRFVCGREIVKVYPPS